MFLSKTGDIFGEMPYFDFNQCYDIVAMDKGVTVYRIEDKVMSALLQVDTNFSERFFQMITTKLSYHLHNLPPRAAISKMNEQVINTIIFLTVVVETKRERCEYL
jgi:CRP-like cAMP-binding protein